jgi:hypothetical protein
MVVFVKESVPTSSPPISEAFPVIVELVIRAEFASIPPTQQNPAALPLTLLSIRVKSPTLNPPATALLLKFPLTLLRTIDADPHAIPPAESVEWLEVTSLSNIWRVSQSIPPAIHFVPWLVTRLLFNVTSLA